MVSGEWVVLRDEYLKIYRDKQGLYPDMALVCFVCRIGIKRSMRFIPEQGPGEVKTRCKGNQHKYSTLNPKLSTTLT